MALALVTLESKRPLIVVVAQYKGIVIRHIGVGDSKNVIVFDPLLTRHVAHAQWQRAHCLLYTSPSPRD